MEQVSTTEASGEPLRIKREDLLRFVSGCAVEPEVFDEISRQLKIEGSPVQRWIAEFRRKVADPLKVDWRAIAVEPDWEAENGEKESEEPSTR